MAEQTNFIDLQLKQMFGSILGTCLDPRFKSCRSFQVEKLMEGLHRKGVDIQKQDLGMVGNRR